ncbi:MAG: glutamate-5-semialdehyde dehydrogenase [Candidatus Omnitrophota bacterium]|nr:glutamate-5-semialdehyde dehydrogenase [Candidatus Omnitrophota bacterium]
MSLRQELINIAKKARQASRQIQEASSSLKNNVLKEMALGLIKGKGFILKANEKDLKKAKLLGLSRAFLERLTLTEKRIKEMSDSLLEISELKDPVGELIKAWKAPSGLLIKKIRVPIGVIAIIYEARPNVTSDCIGLCFKSGNSVILRGGKEALNSNLAIYQALNLAIKKHNLPVGLVNIIDTSVRRAVDELLKLNNYIDLVMPRGGEGLIKKVVELSRIPVIKHYKGICHVYVDKYANLDMAQDICFNAKVERPAVCNAMECMLVHRDIAAKFLPRMLEKFKAAGVQIRGCQAAQKFAKGIKSASQKDYLTEYLDLILSVKVVENLDEALAHINYYGSGHSDAIVTENKKNALKFLRAVDSACVYVNASTRFTDGHQFGLGAEIGISTDKLHARGPVALEELTTYKYIIYGKGQVRTV